MRKLFITLTIIFVILAIGAIATHIILTKKLPDIINSMVIPKAEEALGMKISLGDAEVKLLDGKISISDVKISNPTIKQNSELLSLDELLLNIRLLPLFSQTIDIVNLTVDDIKVNINRDKAGKFNFETKTKEQKKQTVAATEKKEQTKITKKSQAETKQNKSAPLKLSLNKFRCSTVITYTDEEISVPPLTIPFTAKIVADNITTIGTTDDKWGSFNLSGNLLNKPDIFTTSITGKIAPISDTSKISMDIEGAISGIDLTQLGPYTNNLDVTAENITAAIKLKCLNGKIDELSSKLILTMDNVKLSGKLAKQTGDITLPPTLTVNVPIKGTLDSPEIDIVAAIITTVMKNLGGTLGTMLENTTIDGKKLDGDLGEAAKAISNFLKGF
jgi:uncharacterized protein involved in outer membrane biogenesis